STPTTASIQSGTRSVSVNRHAPAAATAAAAQKRMLLRTRTPLLAAGRAMSFAPSSLSSVWAYAQSASHVPMRQSSPRENAISDFALKRRELLDRFRDLFDPLALVVAASPLGARRGPGNDEMQVAVRDMLVVHGHLIEIAEVDSRPARVPSRSAQAVTGRSSDLKR